MFRAPERKRARSKNRAPNTCCSNSGQHYVEKCLKTGAPQDKTGPRQAKAGQDSPRRPKIGQGRPKTSQDRPKTDPRQTQGGPRQAQDKPKTSQDRPMTGQDRPKTAQDRLKIGQDWRQEPILIEFWAILMHKSHSFSMVSPNERDFSAHTTRMQIKWQHSANTAPQAEVLGWVLDSLPLP